MKQVYQKEAETLGLEHHSLGEASLTPYQRSLLDKIRAIEANPIVVTPQVLWLGLRLELGLALALALGLGLGLGLGVEATLVVVKPHVSGRTAA